MQCWLSHYRNDVEHLKRLQRKVTRMLPGLQCISCRESLEHHVTAVYDIGKTILGEICIVLVTLLNVGCH